MYKWSRHESPWDPPCDDIIPEMDCPKCKGEADWIWRILKFECPICEIEISPLEYDPDLESYGY